MWWTEVSCDSGDPREVGDLDVSGTYNAQRKPAWLVALKLVGVLALTVLGLVLVVPWIPLPLWQSLPAALGVLLIYVGVGFFLRPEPNTDNMGWFGGMMNDPFRYSDNINRWLWSLQCFLAPGRFTAETLLDLCVLCGVISEPDPEVPAAPPAPAAPPPPPDRFSQSADFSFGGQVQLSSARFLSAPPQPPVDR